MSPDTAATAGAKTSLGVIFLVLLLDLIGFSIVFPLVAEMLTYYSAHDGGILAAAMARVDALFPGSSAIQRAAFFGGLIGAVYSLLQFIAAPWWGRISDRYGRRPVLLASLAGTLIAYGLWVLSGSFTTFLWSRLLAGLMSGNTAVASAAISDLSTPAQRAKSMALVGIAFGLGFILGPAIGGIAYEYLPHLDHGALSAYGFNPFSTPALIAFVLCAINLVWAWFRFAETRVPQQRIEATRTANPLQLFSPSLGLGVPRINAAFLTYTLLFAGLESTLVFLALEKLSFGPGNNAGLFVFMGFLSAAIQGGVFRRMAPRIGQRPLALAGFVLLLPGFTLIGMVDWFPHTWLLIVGVSLLACGTGLVFPALSTMASLAGDPARQGWVLGAFRSAGALGRAAGPLVAALLYFRFRPAAPYLFAAFGMTLPFLLIARLRVGEAPATDDRQRA